jgi:hypothetical protein
MFISSKQLQEITNILNKQALKIEQLENQITQLKIEGLWGIEESKLEKIIKSLNDSDQFEDLIVRHLKINQ